MDDRDRWNERYRAKADLLATDVAAADTSVAELGGRAGSADRFAAPVALSVLGHHLPDRGLAVDLAGGTGAAAVAYARAGLEPVLVDVSDVALDIARSHCDRQNIELLTVRQDLTGRTLGDALDAVAVGGSEAPLSVVSCFHYLNRPLLASVADHLPEGVVFMAAIATVTNLERNERPSGRFLLDRGELRDLVVGAGDDGPLDVLHWSEDWNAVGHHEAVLAARRSGP